MKETEGYKKYFWILLPFVLSILYWAYLFTTARMDIVFDAIGYEVLGKMLATEGWIKYFETGPNREPLYPFLISLMMRMAKLLSVEYLSLQKILQILILFSSQILIWRILKKLNVRPSISCAILLYWAFSPAIANSGFSLFSEIATYPLPLLILMASVTSFKYIHEKPVLKNIFLGILLGLLFVGQTFIKALYGYILVIYLLPFIALMLYSLKSRNKKPAINALVVIGTIIISFNMIMVPYKLLNEKYNGNYTFTNRGSWLLYGNTAKRLQPVKTKNILACAAFAAGDNLCYKLFGSEYCDPWHLNTVEKLGPQKRLELNRVHEKSDVKKILLILSVEKVLLKPFQYAFITFIENFKLFFWESTKIGCVIYSEVQAKIYNNTLFKNIIRLFASLLSFMAFIFVALRTFKNRKELLKSNPSSLHLYQFFSFWMIASFMLLYMPFFIATRYIFPIVPLYLICWGILLESCLKSAGK